MSLATVTARAVLLVVGLVTELYLAVTHLQDREWVAAGFWAVAAAGLVYVTFRPSLPKCRGCERCTWNPGPDCGISDHVHCPACGHCLGRHAPIDLPGVR